MRYDFTYALASRSRAVNERAEALVASILSLFRRTR